MLDLKNIQDDLLNRLITNNLSPHYIKQYNDIDTSERMQIYRDTIIENYINSLKITYPGIWKLIGEDCARGVALAYSHDLSNIKPRHSLQDFGDKFPNFLRNFTSTKKMQYLADYAQLEWLRYRSYHSKRENTAKLTELQKFFTNENENGKLSLNTSIFFLHSKFALMEIQKLLEDSSINNIDINKSESYIIICKTLNNIETLYLLKNQWNFILDISMGNPISLAMNNFKEHEIEVQLPIMIKLLLSKQMIKNIIE